MATRTSLTRTSGSVITSAWANLLRDHIVPYSGASDGTTDGMLSVNTSDDTLRIGNGTNAVAVASYGAWGTFTADVAQGGGTGSASASECEWTRSGRRIEGGGLFTITSIMPTAGFPIRLLTSGLPLPSGTFNHVIGSFQYQDTGTIIYQGALTLNSAGEMRMQCDAAVAQLGQAPAVTAAVNDLIWVNFRYRAASTT